MILSEISHKSNDIPNLYQGSSKCMKSLDIGYIELKNIFYGFKIMWKKAGDSPPIIIILNGWTQRNGGGYSYD